MRGCLREGGQVHCGIGLEKYGSEREGGGGGGQWGEGCRRSEGVNPPKIHLYHDCCLLCTFGDL